MTRYGALLDWDTDTRSHASMRGYRLGWPETRYSVAALLRAMRMRRVRR